MIREILNTGIVFYVMAALTLAGAVSRLIYYRLYRKFRRESENVSASQNKLIRQIRMKYENAFRVSNGVNNPAALVDKYVYQYRFMGIRLHGWRKMIFHTAVLTVLVGAVGAGLSFWQDIPAGQLVWYGAAGGAGLLFLAVITLATGIRYNEQVMYTNLSDYLENTLAFRLKNECDAEAEVKAERRRQQAKQRMEKEEIWMPEEAEAAEPEPQVAVSEVEEVPKKVKRRLRKRAKEDEIQQMKKNLDQIAADTTERHIEPRSLTKDEQQAIVEDILREYLN